MKYKFKEEQYAKVKAARKANRDKQIDRRLKVLELCCKGKSQQEIVEKTGFHRSHVCNLIKMYFKDGLQAISEKHYAGNRRNMTFEEKAEFLEQFRQKAEQRQMLYVHEIDKEYRKKVGQSIGTT